MTVALWGVGVLAALAALPATVLLVECLAAAWPRRPTLAVTGPAPRVAVIVPAHDESATIVPTLDCLRKDLPDGARTIVVADNCTDDTAMLARSAGAIVLERTNDELRGKGYALNFAVQSLMDDPPDVVVVVDADCQVEPGAILQLAMRAAETRRPIQGRYLMPPPRNAAPGDVLSSFALLVKNAVRPLGMQRLGGPTLLVGSGMALPWELVKRVPFAGGHLVEDVQMAIDLTIEGAPPQYCDEARIWAPLPARRAAAFSQRTRWEHGHLQAIFSQAPRLFASAVRRLDRNAALLALDLIVPPLSLLAGFAVLLWWVAAAGFLVAGAPEALVAASVPPLEIAVGVFLAWLTRGRPTYPASVLWAVPGYILAKLPIYRRFLWRRQKAWVRTERDSPAAV